MFRTEISRLMRKILVLGVLTTGLVIASTGLIENKAGAAICCDQCYVNFDNCLLNCNDNQTCIAGCNATLNHCVLFCNSLCN
jgi:hypothetical protein